MKRAFLTRGRKTQETIRKRGYIMKHKSTEKAGHSMKFHSTGRGIPHFKRKCNGFTLIELLTRSSISVNPQDLRLFRRRNKPNFRFFIFVSPFLLLFFVCKLCKKILTSPFFFPEQIVALFVPMRSIQNRASLFHERKLDDVRTGTTRPGN